jgi:protein-S-isoprenylcysteine O-methyltransferase Ste14
MTSRLVLLASGLLLFSLLHSLLAAVSVRRRLERFVSPRVYRLAYNVLAIACLLGIYLATRGDYPLVWDVRGAARGILRGLQLAAFSLLLATLGSIDLAHFAGLRQLRGEMHERGGLRSGGPYRLCRHPLYLATAVLFSASPTMDLRWLIVAVWLWLYASVGSVFEERKLLDALGDEYRRYRAAHPRLLPFRFRARERDRAAGEKAQSR